MCNSDWNFCNCEWISLTLVKIIVIAVKFCNWARNSSNSDGNCVIIVKILINKK
jgi:hypothetical protein